MQKCATKKIVLHFCIEIVNVNRKINFDSSFHEIFVAITET